VSAVFDAAEVAGWFCLPTLPGPQGLAGVARADGVRFVSASGVGDRWDDFSGYAQTVEIVVSGDLARDEPENGGQCHERAEGLGFEQL
jgi:hypothetical protein